MSFGNQRFLQLFQAEIKPYLEAEPDYRREHTFEQIFTYLEGLGKSEYLIVETGCMRHADWSDGRSTYQFDRFVQCCGGRVVSVDVSSDSCDYARRHTSDQTTIVNGDSVAFLKNFAAQTEQPVDLLYLDSLDVCWEDHHPSALHHLMELCAAMPVLSKTSLVVVDDHGSQAAPGKSAYVAQWMGRTDAKELFNAYQIGWVISPPEGQPPVITENREDDLLAGYFAAPPSYPGDFHGRGIVIPGGGGRYAVCTWVCVNRLRQLGCRLPIQVWYLGAEERDEHLFAALSPLGVDAVDAYAVRERHPHARLRGWELKPYAVLHSPFEEVLLLDADNVPVLDPSFLFDTREYQDTGALFWPDYWRMTPDRSFWKVMGIPYVDEPEFESGQMVVNKRRCWEAITLTNWLCERGAGHFWNHCHGDKDCFRAGWRRTKTPFLVPGRGVTTLSDRVMVQYSFAGERLFQHRNLAKWSLGTNPQIDDFWHEDACLALVADYRRRLLAEKFALSELDLERSAQRDGTHYWYIRCRSDYRLMSFNADLTIGEGSGGMEQMFYEKEGAIVLLDGAGEVTCELQPSGNLWVGRWQRYEGMPVVFEPVE